MKKSDGSWYYEMHELGFNYRLTDIQSSLGLSQLAKLDSFVARRREIGNYYDKCFSLVRNMDFIREKEGYKSSRHLYVILTDNRKLVHDWLWEKADIIPNVHYIPVYFQPYYQKLGYKRGICPKAEKYYSRAISIPMYPKLTDEEMKYVVDRIKTIIGS
jgi:dTDP-4-amino-4,6-dideoxygalactose transaminase